MVQDEAAADVVATGTVRLSDAGYTLTLEVDDRVALQSRELEAADCAVLTRAAALVVVVALDPVQLAARWPEPAPEAVEVAEPPPAEPEERVEPEPVEAAPVEPVAPQAPKPSPRRPGSLEYGVGVGFGVAARTLPGLGFGLELAPFVGVPRVHGRVVAQYRTPRQVAVAGNPDAGARFQLAAVGVRVCPNVMPKATARVRLPLCAGADFGAVMASGEGPDVRNASRAQPFWSAVTLEAGVAVQVARWVSITGAFEAGIALSRPSFALAGAEQLHTVARFAPRGTLGVQFHRPRTFF